MNDAPGKGFEYHNGSHAAFIPEEDRATWITSPDAYDRHRFELRPHVGSQMMTRSPSSGSTRNSCAAVSKKSQTEARQALDC